MIRSGALRLAQDGPVRNVAQGRIEGRKKNRKEGRLWWAGQLVRFIFF
jgi:hypothetical protein